jgi:hypothetical protein
MAYYLLFVGCGGFANPLFTAGNGYISGIFWQLIGWAI